MALPSQTSRVGTAGGFRSSARGYSRRRKSSGAPVLGIAIVLLGIVGLGWWLIGGSGGDADGEQAIAGAGDVTNNDEPASGNDRGTQRAGIGNRTPANALTMGAAGSREPEPRAVRPEEPLPREVRNPEPTPSVARPEPVREPESRPTNDDRARQRNASRSGQPNQQPRQDPMNQVADGAPEVDVLLAQGVAEIEANSPLRARDAFNRALHHQLASDAQQAAAREALARVAEEITFSAVMIRGDEMAMAYEVEPGDSLAGIARKLDTQTEWQLIQRLNGISDPRRIRVGQTLKILRGPFHAIVDKGDYRLDIYHDTRDSAGNRLFVTSFDVGLGEYGSTPLGEWVVKTNSKLVNPKWVNPRTGEVFEANNPDNPIGERWVGLDGVDSNTRLMTGYGIHGTVDLDSIGEDASMGCVRLLPGDVEIVYELLMPGSQVLIVP